MVKKWVGEEELLQLLIDGCLFLPNLHVPAFWAYLDRERNAHISLVLDRLLPRTGSPLTTTIHGIPFPGSI